MHYCFIVITEEFPTNEVIEEKIKPYNEDDFYSQYSGQDEIPEDAVWPTFTWDWWQVGGRYGCLLKLKVDREDEEYGWMFYAKEPRAGRLYRSYMCETLDKANTSGFVMDWVDDKYRGYLGASDGYIRVDGCKVKDVIDFEETIINHGFGFVGKNGEVYVRKYWSGHKFVEDEQYEEKVKEAIKDVQDCYVTYIDVHD